MRLDDHLTRRQLGQALGAASFALLPECGRLPFQVVSSKVPQVGILWGQTWSEPPAAEARAFQQGLQDQGYRIGETVRLEPRLATAGPAEYPALARELVQLRVDIIVTAGVAATRPAQEATRTIPIVMAFSSDPVGAGLIESLARPDGNVTGLTDLTVELSPKRRQLLQEALPSSPCRRKLTIRERGE